MPMENQRSYDGLSISPFAEVTDDGQFIIRIAFVVSNTVDKPRLASVRTKYNLGTMQTVLEPTPTPAPQAHERDDDAEEDEEIDDEDFEEAPETPIIDPHTIKYEYPAAFLSQIHRATKTAWRSGLLRWNRRLTTAELCLFVQLLNRKDFTPIALDMEEATEEEDQP